MHGLGSYRIHYYHFVLMFPRANPQAGRCPLRCLQLFFLSFHTQMHSSATTQNYTNVLVVDAWKLRTSKVTSATTKNLR